VVICGAMPCTAERVFRLTALVEGKLTLLSVAQGKASGEAVVVSHMALLTQGE